MLYNGSPTPGLIELPAAGDYTGTLLVEHVIDEPNGIGGWSENSVELSNGTGSATVDAQGNIVLKQDGSDDAVFTGKMTVTPASGSKPGKTTVKLTAFDGHVETYAYTLADETPKRLEILCRGTITKTATRYEFDRYSYELTLAP